MKQRQSNFFNRAIINANILQQYKILLSVAISNGWLLRGLFNSFAVEVLLVRWTKKRGGRVGICL